MNANGSADVLVVDDDAAMRRLIARAVAALGLRAVDAVDGADAIYQSISGRFALITMDIMMPNVDGLEAIRAIRMVDPLTPIVVISSRDDEETRRAIGSLGVTRFLPKPFEYAALTAFLAAAFADASRAGAPPPLSASARPSSI